ncbi:hypothetical protein B0H16DRAFT_1330984 [Mycena metata]|uniref:Uncharacterized protein n=1 Tax=Mycena metata TaxID=1033252 RepID=A0AAD7MR84_9AGAR|nr:hypothetical protein B0H16DRAFT_1330984 [Mycena metata]
MGDIVAIQAGNGDTRLFFQDSTGDILEWGVTGVFTTGHNEGSSVLVPANEVLPHTPIVAITANTAAYTAVRLYFLSPDYILSEYIWPTTIATSRIGFMGGPSCTACLTAQGIVASSSEVLYAMANAAFNQFRVGFISPGEPTTLSEAENLGSGWQVATYPN